MYLEDEAKASDIVTGGVNVKLCTV